MSLLGRELYMCLSRGTRGEVTGRAEMVSFSFLDAASPLREMSVCVYGSGLCLSTEDNLDNSECPFARTISSKHPKDGRFSQRHHCKLGGIKHSRDLSRTLSPVPVALPEWERQDCHTVFTMLHCPQ